MDSFYVTAVILAMIGAAVFVPLFTSSRRASAELHLKPLWERRCVGKMGAIGIGLPAIRVALYEDFIVIAFLGQTVIPYENIAEVSLQKGIPMTFATGVTLKLKGLRSYYVFKMRDPKRFVEIVRSRLTLRCTTDRPQAAGR